MAHVYKTPSSTEELEPLIAVPTDPTVSYGKLRPDNTRRTKFALLAMAVIALLLLIRLVLSLAVSADVMPITPPIPIPDSIKHEWGPYTPYFALSTYTNPPNDCKITQVNILQRHGARFPTSGPSASIQAAMAKLQAVSKFNDPKLNFVKNYTYDLSGTGDLISFGAAQSFDSGQLDFERYEGLVSPNDVPFVRASSSSRVVFSASNWTAGFAHASGEKSRPSLNVILQESLNDTLDDSMCPNAGSGDTETDEWQSIYASPIAARLNGAAPGANLTASDVTNLISLCPFDTLFRETPSPFCELFSQTDFDGFEYFNDLSKFYGTGYGQELGPVQGVGYVNELLARLTDSPVHDSTQTNHTLDADPATFPLNRTLYADFSHDNQMAAIYAALGLFRPALPLDPRVPDPNRLWVASKLTPFSARLVTERLDCGGETFVRMFLNDEQLDLGICGASAEGLCSLDAFVNSQAFARNNGDGLFEKCFS